MVISRSSDNFFGSIYIYTPRLTFSRKLKQAWLPKVETSLGAQSWNKPGCPKLKQVGCLKLKQAWLPKAETSLAAQSWNKLGCAKLKQAWLPKAQTSLFKVFRYFSLGSMYVYTPQAIFSEHSCSHPSKRQVNDFWQLFCIQIFITQLPRPLPSPISLNFTALWNRLFCESVIKLTLSWQVGSQIMGKVISWSFQGFKVFRYFHLVVYTYTPPGSPFQWTTAPSPPQEGREQECTEKVSQGCIRIYYLQGWLVHGIHKYGIE